MEIVEKLTKAKVLEWLASEEDEFILKDFEKNHQVTQGSTNLRVILRDLVGDNRLKPVGIGRYRKVKKVLPVDWIQSPDGDELPFLFPSQHKYGTSSFNLDGVIQVYAGDMVVIAGVSNSGKSALCKNILADNLTLFEASPVLMGNEYTASNGEVTPKFKRSMMAMDVKNGGWVEWADDSGKSRFDLIPVKKNWEDYIRPDALNIVDWINVTDNFFQVGAIFESLKGKIGKGLLVAVIQKDQYKDRGVGGNFSEHLADVYLSVDPLVGYQSRLTVGKVKASVAPVRGRMFGFGITDGGGCLVGIREIETCAFCGGKKRLWSKSLKREIDCVECNGVGYKNKYAKGENGE